MTFGYYARLSRAQQAIYRKSDGIPEVRLPRPELLSPLVEDLAAALAGEDRRATQAASARLVQGLTGELGLPPVRVQVLAARPHRHWGELHGLYTAERGRVPRIQVWMRTAKQRRVVAFRTYLRTIGWNEEAGAIDIDIIAAGASSSQQDRMRRVLEIIRRLSAESGGEGAKRADIEKEAVASMPSIPAGKVEEALKILKERGMTVTEPSPLLKAKEERDVRERELAGREIHHRGRRLISRCRLAALHGSLRDHPEHSARYEERQRPGGRETLHKSHYGWHSPRQNHQQYADLSLTPNLDSRSTCDHACQSVDCDEQQAGT